MALGCNGADCPWSKPSVTGYSGPAYTGAAGQVKAVGALAGVGAFAALLL